MNKVANEPLVHEDDEAGLKGFPASMPLEDQASEMQLKSIITLAYQGSTPKEARAAIAMHQRIMKAFELEVAGGASAQLATMALTRLCWAATVKLLEANPWYADQLRKSGPGNGCRAGASGIQ
jgi:hypothetical protein